MIFLKNPKATELENVYELNGNVVKRQTELRYSVLIEVCTGPVSTMTCLCPVVARKPEAQVEKGARDSGLQLESGPMEATLLGK